MHQGRPYGLHVVGNQLTEDDESFVSATARRFTNLKSIRDIESLKLVYELPDGGSFIIQDMGGNFRVIAHKPIYTERYEFDGRASTYIPMLFSGAVLGYGLIRDGYGLPLKLTKHTARRLMGYGKDTAPTNVELARFVCKYGPGFQEFMPQRVVNGATYTQYIHQRPTWYSGAMAEVMQIVGGYGKQDLEKLPDDPIERATFKVPDKYQDSIKATLDRMRLPGYSGIPNEDGQFQCDYKSFKTNLVSFDDAMNPWLIRVDSAGVWAMPLPVVPATTTEAFREYIEVVGDEEIKLILDRFGGMPSGENFPISSSAFQAWRRAGVIIKVCDTKDFYKNLPYSSAMGWSSNLTGTEIVNTCYDLDWTTGKITAFAYKGKLELGSAKEKGWILSRTSSSITLDYEKINNYLQFLYGLIEENTPTNIAIKYKINRVSLAEISIRANNQYSESEVNYWNNLELPPIAIHKGNINKIDEGVYFGGAGVKVPEPMLGGCISIPRPLPKVTDRNGKKDTIVLAYYIGDSLKTVRLFEDDRPQNYKVETNFETYMYVGQWYKRELLGDARILGDIYTSDIDDRFISSPTEIETNVDGKDLGFGGAILQMDYYFWRTGNLFRKRYYTTKTHTKTTTGKGMSLAVAIPYLCRNALLYAKTTTAANVNTKETFLRGEVYDPHRYRIWTYTGPVEFGSLPVMNGSPYPVDGRPVYAEILEYSPNESNAWANEGDWVGDLPADVTPLLYDYSKVIWAFRAEPPPPPVGEYSRSTETKNMKDQELKCQVYDGVEKVRKGYHSDLYYSLLPDAYMNTLDENACKVLFGSKRYANISEVNETGNRKQWGESALVDNRSAHHFIGVINE